VCSSDLKEKISIHSFVTIGLNTGVVKSIKEPGTYIGTPSIKIK
jgi:UDP-3-O-[3-hydroxymyristoyl] glucosamine N-acyltransferase